MKQVRLELDGSWVLKHRSDEKLPVEIFVDAVSAKFNGNIKVSSSSLTECEILLPDSQLSSDEITGLIAEILQKEFSLNKESGAVTYCVNDMTDSGNPAEPAASARAEAPETAASTEARMRGKNGILSETETKAASVSEQVASLVGADEFKDLIQEFTLIAPKVVEHNTLDVFAFQNYLFAINQGCGLSTYLKLFAESFEENGLFKFGGKDAVIEKKLLPPSDKVIDPFSPVLSYFNGHTSKAGKLICIDISEWLPHLSTKQFRNFLSVLEDNAAQNIIVFRIPFVEADVLSDINAALSDILFVRSVAFPPMTSEELVECAKRELSKFHFTAEATVWEVFERRIAEEKSDGRFYGLNTVNKVIREMIYRKQLYSAKNDIDDTVIKDAEISRLSRTPAGYSEGLLSLEQMIGMEELRRNVDEIVTQIGLARSKKGIGNPCLHMRFIGNPGTGKTTVARIVGKILKERGVLRNGNFFEYSGRDFCGRYVGETAPKTAAMCRDAYGSVLFIDEAYSLYRGEGDDHDFGREALDTLIAEMENHRGDLVVIMAGYPDEMEELMNGNAGLESRMPYELVFPNYSREQLYQIYMQMVDGKIPHEESFPDAVKAFFDAISDEVISSKKFSNARFVRNLFERTCAKAGTRQKLDNSENLVLTKADFSLASSEKIFLNLMEKKRENRIGF